MEEKNCASMPGNILALEKEYVWQRYLDSAGVEASNYHDNPRRDLVNLIGHPPRLVLELGCGLGSTGAMVKEKYPEARVFGVEINREAARVAATRLDKVLVGNLDEIDFAEEGIGPGEVDVVMAGDVLEHLYNPWQVILKLKPFLSSDVQIVASIPNVRHLGLMEKQAEGHWRYDASGLLDVTHIRFFTLKEVKRFFYETGYLVTNVVYGLDPALREVHQKYLKACPADIDTGKLVFRNVSQEELDELCSMQFFVTAEPLRPWDATERDEYGDPLILNAYELWQRGRVLTPELKKLYALRRAQWSQAPSLHIAVLHTQRNEGGLTQTIRSLSEQLYLPNCVTVVSSAPPPRKWLDSDKLRWRQANDGLLDGANRALEAEPADWVGVIDEGDLLSPHALFLFAEASHAHDAWQVIYSDEDRLDASGERDLPHFKPDFNLDLLRSYPYIGGLLMVRWDLFRSLNGFDPKMLGVEEHDLALRAFERVGAPGIGHIADVLYHRSRSGGHCSLPVAELVEKGRQAVSSHLQRLEVSAEVVHGVFPASYRVRYRHSGTPLVSILVVAGNVLSRLQRCVEALLRYTAYPNYEVLMMADARVDGAARAFLEGLNGLADRRIRAVIGSDVASPYALRNRLAGEAKGEFLLFLHDGGAPLQADWLEGLLAHAARPEVGMAGPRLLSPDGKVLQAGAVLGLGDRPAGRLYSGVALDYPGYYGRALLEQDYSALSESCFMVRKALFDEVEAFDEQVLPNAFGGTDLGLRLKSKGYELVCTPYVSIVTEEDDPGDGAAKEVFYDRWLPRLARDPSYNPNLSLREGFLIETSPSLTWDPCPWKPLPRILVNPADEMGCGEYRITAPARALSQGLRAEIRRAMEIFQPPEIERVAPDAIVMQRQMYPHQVEAIRRYKRYSKANRVYELDDLITMMPSRSVHSAEMPQDVGAQMKAALALCDRFVVSTEPLAEAYRHLHPDIRVVPNYVERAKWEHLSPLRGCGPRPRVGWAGGIGHTGDLEIIIDVVKALHREVDWVFFGMCPDAIRPYVREFHEGVILERYPAKLASLNLDLALAPLETIPFNEAKSHLKLLEYGILGYPVICTDIFPYQGPYPVMRVRNTFQEWVAAIREHLSDMGECARRGNVLREYVRRHWMLEDHLDVWLDAWLGR